MEDFQLLSSHASHVSQPAAVQLSSKERQNSSVWSVSFLGFPQPSKSLLQVVVLKSECCIIHPPNLLVSCSVRVIELLHVSLLHSH